jgi:hypothetical protein
MCHIRRAHCASGEPGRSPHPVRVSAYILAPRGGFSPCGDIDGRAFESRRRVGRDRTASDSAGPLSDAVAWRLPSSLRARPPALPPAPYPPPSHSVLPGSTHAARTRSQCRTQSLKRRWAHAPNGRMGRLRVQLMPPRPPGKPPGNRIFALFSWVQAAAATAAIPTT